MAARHSVVIPVSNDMELFELEAALSTGELESIVVDIPEGATTLATGREFRRLLDLARGAGVKLEFRTDDPMRRELAAILGAHVNGHTGHVSTGNDQATRKIGATLAQPATRQPQREPEIVADPTDDSFSFVITPPVTRRPVERSSAPQTSDRPPTPRPSTARGTAPRHRRARRRRLIGWSASVAGLLVGALAAVGLLVPSATITLVPVTAQVSADFTYGVAGPTAAYDLEVDPRPVSATLTFTSSIPTTGQRFVPDGTALGTLLLTNPTTDDVVIEAGTSFESDAGVAFTTTEEVVVPAADPFVTRSFGSAEVPIAAVAPGPDGNVSAEAIVGQLASGVFYTNQAPTAGGTVRRIATVAQADLDLLKSRAEADLRGRAGDALAPQLGATEQLLDGSVQQGTIATSFDHAVNTDATSVAINASLTVNGLAYSLDELAQQAHDAAGRRLAALAGRDRILLVDTVTIGQPEPIAGTPTPAFRVHATGTVRAMIDPATLDTLRDDLVGKSADQADARLTALDTVAGYSIDLSPGWLPDRLPFMKDRISVVVTTETTPSQTRPATTSGP